MLSFDSVTNLMALDAVIAAFWPLLIPASAGNSVGERFFGYILKSVTSLIFLCKIFVYSGLHGPVSNE
jgi:hypothetical protein